MYEDIFFQIRQEAEKRNLKDSTIDAYCNSVGYFLRTVDKDVATLSTDDVDSFLTEKRLNGIAPQTYNHYHSSIRFFYKRILKLNWDDEDIPRMKLDHSLPTVLSRDEIQRIIDNTPNLKHKAIIATMYSSGLRVSEVVHLHYDDISRTNKTIHVRESKSRRDRYTILSDRNLDLLTEYWYKCGRPRDILFPSSWTGTYLDKCSINQYFKKSAARAGITRHVSSHCCRHSFASHLFEDGADIGYICILHTWGSEMNFHPHIHAIVIGGGLDPNNHWKDNGEDFFLPIRVISRLFRGKYLAELKQLWEDDKLEFHGTAEPYRNHYVFKELINSCYSKEWIPYCKKPFDGAESVIRYLGKYTHRIAISNYRIKSMNDSYVTFTAKDYKNQGHWKEITISGEEFIRRFLMHVPPKRFVRIRHYGLLSSRNKNHKITLCRNLLGCKKYLSRLKDLDAPAIIRLIYNKDVCKCVSCGGKIIPLSANAFTPKLMPHLLC